MRLAFALVPLLVSPLACVNSGPYWPPPITDSDRPGDEAEDSDAAEAADTDAALPPNRVNGTTTGGHARVVALTAYDAEGAPRPDAVFNTSLEPGCFGLWAAAGALCDALPTTDDPEQSTHPNTSSGATFSGAAEGVTGVLLIDACADGACATVEVSRASVFQMFSDGKVTAVRVSVHDATDVAPAWDDPGWRRVSDPSGRQRGLVEVGPGASLGAGAVVTDPTRVEFGGTFTTRFLMVEVRNDGRHGDPEFTELRAIKVF